MDAAVLEKRLARERRAREEAERILEAKSRELYRSNENLKAASAELERQSGQLTAILENTRPASCWSMAAAASAARTAVRSCCSE